MTCTGSVTAKCQRGPTRRYRVGVFFFHWCDICHAAATAMGAGPVAA